VDGTLRKAALTSGWVMSLLVQRFSIRSLLDPPELRQAMLMLERRVVGDGDAGRRLGVRLQRRESGRVPRISGTSSLRFASVDVSQHRGRVM
jgi:hypothetical protein